MPLSLLNSRRFINWSFFGIEEMHWSFSAATATRKNRLDFETSPINTNCHNSSVAGPVCSDPGFCFRRGRLNQRIPCVLNQPITNDLDLMSQEKLKTIAKVEPTIGK
jgi:hypothetical protein